MRNIILPILVGIVVIPLFWFGMHSMVTSGDEYEMKNVTFIDTKPAPNTTSDVFMVFQDEKGKEIKLNENEDQVSVYKEGNQYNITFLMNHKAYPYDYILKEAVPAEALAKN